jgi:predicted transcriptional regulator
MSQPVPLNTEIDQELYARLHAHSEQTGKDARSIVADALRAYFEADEDFVAAVEEGIRAADDGDLLSHEAVEKELRARRRTP